MSIIKTIKKYSLKLKRNIRNILVEEFRRLNSCNNIFEVNHDGISNLFYLPNRRDVIQQWIILNKEFYEKEELNGMKKIIKPSSVILDIGANIGNHTLFFCNILKAKKVYSFEPSKNNYRILEKNIQINNLQNKVELFNIGLGDKELNCKLTIPRSKRLKINMGGTKLIDNEKGNTKVLALDKIHLRARVDFIKMDVEGFEDKVLIGAINLIKKDLPIIFIEIKDRNLISVKDYFNKLGYSKPIQTSRENYLLIHPGRKDNGNI